MSENAEKRKASDPRERCGGSSPLSSSETARVPEANIGRRGKAEARPPEFGRVERGGRREETR